MTVKSTQRDRMEGYFVTGVTSDLQGSYYTILYVINNSTTLSPRRTHCLEADKYADNWSIQQFVKLTDSAEGENCWDRILD